MDGAERLPHGDKAVIPTSKLTAYLLSETHPVGRWKSKFFRSLGFTERNVDELAAALAEIAGSGNVVELSESEHGEKYVVDGFLQSAGGQKANLRTVWIIGRGETQPRFVTSYPR